MGMDGKEKNRSLRADGLFFIQTRFRARVLRVNVLGATRDVQWDPILVSKERVRHRKSSPTQEEG